MNYNGQKDTQVLRIQARQYDENIFSGVLVDEIILRNDKDNYRAIICLCNLYDLKRCLFLDKLLHPQEKAHFDMLQFERRKKSFALGRISAKKAISDFLNEDDPRNILIQSGIFNHPVIGYPGNSNAQVSITHCDDLGASIAFKETYPMGIDIEKVNSENLEVISSQLTREEVDLLQALPYPHEEMLTLLWTAKEALSKVLKTGLMTPLNVYEINEIIFNDSYYTSMFKNFGQYKTISFSLGCYICSIAYPKNTDMDINLLKIRHFYNCTQY